ncbi:MAG: methyltransferase [bacterium]
MEIGIYNLWILFVPAYGIIWLTMIKINKKRGIPIEDPKLVGLYGKRQLFFGFLPHLLLVFMSFFVPIIISTFFFLGTVLFLLGFVIDIVAISSFAFDKNLLNTSGVYSISRNPMYLGGFFMIAGLNLLGFSHSPESILFLSFSLFWCVGTHVSVLTEEGFLEGKYGNDYLQYKNRTSRYFGLKKNKN